MLIAEYYGSELNLYQCEEIAVKKFDTLAHQKELQLFKSKWFEYRHLHPTKATYLYAHHFLIEFRKTYQKCWDKKQGQYIHWTTGGGINKTIDPLSKREAIGLWKGRQAADSIGASYDFYIKTAMDILIEQVLWKRVPRPVHLYSPDLIGLIEVAWQESLRTSIKEPEISHLSDDNIFTQNLKLEIETWLCEQIQRKMNPVYALANFLFDKGLITEQKALQFFSQSEINKAYQFFLNSK